MYIMFMCTLCLVVYKRMGKLIIHALSNRDSNCWTTHFSYIHMYTIMHIYHSQCTGVHMLMKYLMITDFLFIFSGSYISRLAMGVGSVTLDTCFNHFTKEEILDGDDKPVRNTILSLYLLPFLYLHWYLCVSF